MSRASCIVFSVFLVHNCTNERKNWYRYRILSSYGREGGVKSHLFSFYIYSWNFFCYGSVQNLDYMLKIYIFRAILVDGKSAKVRDFLKSYLPIRL